MPISRCLPSVAAVLLVSLLACTSQPAGSIQLVASVPQALTASDVTRVKVTVSASNMSSVSVDLTRSNGSWGGFLGSLPAGANRSVLAEAFDASGTVRFQGQASGVTITANQPATVVLTLQELAKAPPYSNEAPVITSLVASTSIVQTGGALSLAATAHDANTEDTLTLAWTSSGGTFSAPTAAATSWTAPASPGIQTLTLTVTDSQGLAATFSLAVNVVSNLSSGSAALNLSFNFWPVVSKVSASLNPLDAGQSTAVSAQASDSDGDGLSYQWDSSCPGTWTNATSSTASFVPSSIPASVCNNCRLTVTVQDGRGGKTTGSVNLCVAAASIERFAPFFTQGTQSSAGQTVAFDVTAQDPQGSSLTFAWTADSGSLAAAQHTATTSHVVWTPPSAQPSTPPTITVTVTNAYGLSASKQFQVDDPCAGVVCNGAPDTCFEEEGTCSNGTCSYAPKAAGASCNDSDSCTTGDVCDGAGGCSGTASQCSSPPGQCYQAAGTCSDGSCSYAYKGLGELCNDGDACTVGEVCNGAGGCSGTSLSCNSPPGQCYQTAGTCSNGTCSYAPKDSGSACASDSNACTSDVCDGTGACAHPALAAGTPCGSGKICDGTTHCDFACWIGGTYYAPGATNPSAACQECNPSLSTSSWSFKPSTTRCRDSGGVCDVAEYCTGTTAACPADAVVAAGTSCRASSGVCDVAEACNGSSKTCPADGLASNGTSCGSSAGAWGSCGGFSDFCDTTGTESRTVTASTCGAGTCSASSTTTETRGCTRAAPDTSCAAPSYGAWSACEGFSDTCAQTGTKRRTVTSYSYSCVTGQCVASTSTETQACTRDTTNTPCGTTMGACSECSSGSCSEWGTQSCTVTNNTCSGGVCRPSSSSSQTQSCWHNTNGDSCGSSSSCGACTTSNYCSGQGTQVCTVSNYSCSSGSCSSANSSSYSQPCPVDPPDCGPSSTSYGAWSACSGFSGQCGETGIQSRTVTVTGSTPNCSTGRCVSSSSSYTETQSCSRSVPAYVCDLAPGAWGPCEGFDNACDATGVQRTQTLVSVCGGGTCNPYSYLPDSRECTRTLPPPPQCSGPTYEPMGQCSGTDVCGQWGTQLVRVTTYSFNPSSCQCEPSYSTQTQSCTGAATPPYAVCGNTCLDTSSDFNNCGACGRRCPNFKFVCEGGHCVDF